MTRVGNLYVDFSGVTLADPRAGLPVLQQALVLGYKTPYKLTSLAITLHTNVLYFLSQTTVGEY